MLRFTDPKDIILRPYQSDAIEALRQNVRVGRKRIVLVAGTGAGKTLMSASLMKEAARKGSYALFIVDRVPLVEQTSAVLSDYGIPHGIVQGANKRWAPREDIQVCSTQTLGRRILPRDPDLIVVDEAHCQYKDTIDFMARYPDAVKIGLTATPFTKGMGRHWDCVVNVIPTRELIAAGYLVEPKIYVAKSPNDAEFGRNSFGEFSDDSASSAGIKIVGDVVQEWIGKVHEHFGGPAKTIVFSPTVEHGRELCAAFAANKLNFQQVSYLDRNDHERLEKIEEFRRPDSLIHGLVSCGVLTKGFDVPDVRVGISCRPYRKSLSSHIQEIGRVMRPIPGETKTALWLDHSGNIERFSLDMFDVWENGAGELDKAEKRDSVARERDSKTREKVVCPKCSGAIRSNICMSCGWERPARSGIHAVAGELREFDAATMGIMARDGLRADCLNSPRKVWEAALNYCASTTRKGEVHARRWAYGIYLGIYPDSKPPSAWYHMPIPAAAQPDAYDLVVREVRRFRKNSSTPRAA